MSSICRMCQSVDSQCGSPDGPEYCSECHSVEEGFFFIEDVEINGDTFCVDENGSLYSSEDYSLIGSYLDYE